MYFKRNSSLAVVRCPRIGVNEYSLKAELVNHINYLYYKWLADKFHNIEWRERP